VPKPCNLQIALQIGNSYVDLDRLCWTCRLLFTPSVAFPRNNMRLRSMLEDEPGGPVPPVVRSRDPHNLGDAARAALGSQLWELQSLSLQHPDPLVRQAATALAAMPIDGQHLPERDKICQGIVAGCCYRGSDGRTL
jgi:hypothetical protein